MSVFGNWKNCICCVRQKNMKIIMCNEQTGIPETWVYMQDKRKIFKTHISTYNYTKSNFLLCKNELFLNIHQH
jgi:hypothetical protein